MSELLKGAGRGEIYLAGTWTSGDAGQLPIIEPALDEASWHVDTPSHEQIDQAVAAAVEAQRALRVTSPGRRADWLREIAKRLQEVREPMARLESRNVGKPLAEALLDVDDAVGCFLYYSALAETLEGAHNAVIAEPSPDVEIRVRHEPVGVSVLVIPWNFPLLTTAWKLAPALAAGCACLVKPSEFTPLTALALAGLIEPCGLPRGTLSVLSGNGPDVGERLCRHRDVSKISFTGSTETGRRVAHYAADDYKRLTVEAGGKSPIIVFDDVPTEQAVEWILFGALYNQGEVCNATSRVLIEAGAFSRIRDRLLLEVQKLMIGPPGQDGVQLGPLQNRPQREKFLRHVERGAAEGEALLYGGVRHPDHPRGLYVLPAVFESRSATSALWREEVFGPLMVLRSFSSEEEAVQLANDSDYGLAAAILTGDQARADRVAASLDAGCIWQGCSGLAFVQGPWGGFKKSGVGRELGRWGLESFQEVKQVTRYRSSKPWGWYLK